MKRNELSIDRTLHSRFECKYMVNSLLVPEIRQYIQPFVEPDQAPEPIREVLEALPVKLNIFKMMANAETSFRPSLWKSLKAS